MKQQFQPRRLKFYLMDEFEFRLTEIGAPTVAQLIRTAIDFLEIAVKRYGGYMLSPDFIRECMISLASGEVSSVVFTAVDYGPRVGPTDELTVTERLVEVSADGIRQALGEYMEPNLNEPEFIRLCTESIRASLNACAYDSELNREAHMHILEMDWK